MRTVGLHETFAVGVAIALAAIAAAGCGDDGAEGERQVELPESKTELVNPEEHNEREKLYAPNGDLLESDETVAGLTLPRGLEPFFEKERRHVYRTTIPLEKLQKYFGPRLTTGEVKRIGEGAIYRNAVPRDAQGAKVKMHVKILPGSDKTRVEIEEIPPPPRNPPSLEELREKARNQKLE